MNSSLEHTIPLGGAQPLPVSTALPDVAALPEAVALADAVPLPVAVPLPASGITARVAASDDSRPFADPSDLGVFGYDLPDRLGSGELTRVVVAARSRRHAVRLLRHAGFRVRHTTPPLESLPYREVELASLVRGVVVWHSLDPEVAQRWFWLPR